MASIRTAENQTLALAGLFQAVHLCKSLATTGTCDQEDLAGTLQSILTVDADHVIDAYGGNAQSIRRGLRQLKLQLAGNNESRDLDLARYAFALIALGTNVMNDPKTTAALGVGINKARALDFPVTDRTLINNLADLYRTSISHLSPRIMVSGDPRHLNDDEVAATIRAVLLGGLRSVVLWRQCGGSRWKLLFQRGQHVRYADNFLKAGVH